MQIVHDKVANFNHIMVKLVVIPQKFVSLQLTPSHFKKLLKELPEPRKVKIILLEELVTNCCSSQLHDEIIYSLDMILDFSGIVSLDLMRLHFLPIGFLELGREFLVLLLRDKIFPHFIFWIKTELILNLRRASVKTGPVALCLACLTILSRGSLAGNAP